MKLKTKSSVSKRFFYKNDSVIKYKRIGKRHNMRNKTSKFIRQASKMCIVDSTNVHKLLQFVAK